MSNVTVTINHPLIQAVDPFGVSLLSDDPPVTFTLSLAVDDVSREFSCNGSAKKAKHQLHAPSGSVDATISDWGPGGSRLKVTASDDRGGSGSAEQAIIPADAGGG